MSPTAPPPIIDQTALALAPVDAETTALSRWEAIAADIRIAAQDAQGKSFDYRDAIGNRQARSWVAQLRKLKGSIERARKDAKAVHLERGRAVDQAAKDLAAEVELLIHPHETELLAIEAQESARIAAHQSIIDRIAALVDTDDVIHNGTSNDIERRIAELTAIDPSTMEEFAIRATADRDSAIEHLKAFLTVLREQEAQAAELEALRVAEAARLEAERIEKARQQATEEERQRQQQEREAAAWREQQALAAAESARQAQADAERRAAEAESREQERLAEQARAEQARADAMANRKAEFVQTLIGEMKGMNRENVADAIVDGSLHPAVVVNWELV
jgi:colicin import membrane protein